MTAQSYLAPGVYLDVKTRKPAPAFETGVPAFLGFSTGTRVDPWATLPVLAVNSPPRSRVISVDGPLWSRLEKDYCTSPEVSYLGFAVRGFFENGGRRCYIVEPDVRGLEPGLDELDAVTDFDLICAPDLVRIADPSALLDEQQRILRFAAARRGCFVILDPLSCPGVNPSAELDRVKAHRDSLGDVPRAAMYVPWVKVIGAGFIPPSGHVAGVFARTDQRVGVHKAPANEPLQGVFDLQIRLAAADQEGEEGLNAKGINAIRSFPGRGIRIWGARTLGKEEGSAYVNVQRLVLTVGRWLEQAMASVAFEPNDPSLWIRVRRDVDAFLGGLFDKGALQGNTRDEAYFVKCDAETNPPRVRDAGQVVAEIGLSPRAPGEFIELRVTLGREGVSAASP